MCPFQKNEIERDEVLKVSSKLSKLHEMTRLMNNLLWLEALPSRPTGTMVQSPQLQWTRVLTLGIGLLGTTHPGLSTDALVGSIHGTLR